MNDAEKLTAAAERASKVLPTVIAEIIAEEMYEAADDVAKGGRGYPSRILCAEEILEMPERPTTRDEVERVAAAMWPGPPEWGAPVLEALGHAAKYRQMARLAIAELRSSPPPSPRSLCE